MPVLSLGTGMLNFAIKSFFSPVPPHEHSSLDANRIFQMVRKKSKLNFEIICTTLSLQVQEHALPGPVLHSSYHHQRCIHKVREEIKVWFLKETCIFNKIKISSNIECWLPPYEGLLLDDTSIHR